ncbi:MAG: PEP-utilizing enzyme, partial [Thermosynechococcaceae cyanobacterium]
TQCQDCYDDPAAAQYRQDRGVPEGGMAVIVQVQVQGQFSGVAFSRDPITGNNADVAIEALPGPALQVVSGQITPERYWVTLPDPVAGVPSSSDLTTRGEVGKLPPDLIRQVALLVRDLERRYHGIPQDMEWTYDGTTLWVLQTRPITTLTPIWTRRIAAEVIPGAIRPLTWSINNPLTCGVWAELFRQILGSRSLPFNVRELATLHYGHAYFNATLMGQLFLQMGLPPESLDFLTRGASMGRPAPLVLLKTLPGLLRLLWQEWTLAIAFRRDQRALFTPCLARSAEQSAQNLSPEGCLDRIDTLLTALRRATFFSILAPISTAIRQKLWRVSDAELDATVLPEAAALRSLWALAVQHQEAIAALSQDSELSDLDPANPLAQDIERFLAQYGHLSEAATDIAIPTWREDPQPIWGLLQGFGAMQTAEQTPSPTQKPRQRWAARMVQRRLALKGQVADVYCTLLAQLRYTLLALAHHGIHQGLLQHSEDIFFLTLSEIRTWIGPSEHPTAPSLPNHIADRRHEFELAQDLPGVPTVIYGTPPPLSILQNPHPVAVGAYAGIGASPGFAEGTVCVLRSLRNLPSNLSRQTILVVPYTDAGWSPILARVGGIVAEVGGRLSHGAIVAREYGIPAVMEIAHATQRFKDGQRVKVDGYRGIVEVLPPEEG